MDTLLERARESKPADKDTAALAVACAFGEITLTQASEACGRHANAMYATLWRGIKDAARLGLLKRTSKNG